MTEKNADMMDTAVIASIIHAVIVKSLIVITASGENTDGQNRIRGNHENNVIKRLLILLFMGIGCTIVDNDIVFCRPCDRPCNGNH